MLDEALELFDYDAERKRQQEARSKGRYLGIGVAFEVMPEGGAIPGVGGGFDSATVRINPSGQVTVLTGVTSPGGGNDTALAQIVSQELGVAIDDIEVIQGDTDLCPFGFGNGTGRSVVTGALPQLSRRAICVSGSSRSQPSCSSLIRATSASKAGSASVTGSPEKKSVPLADVARSFVTLSHLTAIGVDPSLEPRASTAYPTSTTSLTRRAG